MVRWPLSGKGRKDCLEEKSAHSGSCMRSAAGIQKTIERYSKSLREVLPEATGEP